jgi:hypothetical protein
MLKIFSKGIIFLPGINFQNKKIFFNSSFQYLKHTSKIDKNYFDYVK